jgi:TusE/DsrC/DsvC family sulfur relay protein
MIEQALDQKLATLTTQREAVRERQLKMVVPLIVSVEQRKGITAATELDEYGLMLHPKTWSAEVAQLLAKGDGIGELTQHHWWVIDYLRHYYLEFGIVPPVRLLERHTGFSLQLCRPSAIMGHK